MNAIFMIEQLKTPTAREPVSGRRRFCVPGWPGLWAFFKGYDLKPWRIREYKKCFANLAQIRMDVVHFPKILVMHADGVSSRSSHDPSFDREFDDWSRWPLESEIMRVRFDFTKCRHLTNHEGLEVFYEPEAKL